MGVILLLLTIGLTAVSAEPSRVEPSLAEPIRPEPKIIGGGTVLITSYPYAASLIYSRIGSGVFSQACGGSIISNKVVLTAAYCLYGEPVNRWRIQVGSASASSGGVVHTIARSTIHPNYNPQIADSDIGLLHITTTFSFNNNVRAGSIAGANYNIPDNESVFAIGWGLVTNNGAPSNTLRQVQIWTVNRVTCRSRYSGLGYTITDNMLCAGWFNVGGRGQCVGDTGSPLIHGSVIVGVYSWSYQCGLSSYPGVNTFVPRYTNWIVANA